MMTNKKWNKILILLSVCFFTLFLFALLNRLGSLILLWKEESLGNITHDAGYGWYAFVPDENISKLGLPFYFLEDGTALDQGPVSVNEDLTASIKEEGGGRYQLLKNNDLYFSASDGQPEAHEYSILSPQIIRNRYLLALFCPTLLIFLCDLALCLRRRNFDLFIITLRWITAILFVMLLIPWNSLILPGTPVVAGSMQIKPVLQRNLIFTVLLFVLTLFNALFPGKNKFLQAVSIIIVIVSTVFYFVPEWNYYGRRADSGAYLQHYTASSIRTPGYPLFIETVYRLTGNEGLDGLRAEDELSVDEALHNSQQEDSSGLIDVVRAQKVVLGLTFLVLFAVFCRYYDAIWFVFLSQVVLCGGFLGADNSYVMSECLSQAILLLAAAMFILTMKGKKALPFIILCVSAGAAILIRPANIFLVIPIFIGGVKLLRGKRKQIPALIIGVIVFGLICAIPAAVIYQSYGIFVWMPTSGYVEISRAVDLMEAGDEDAFTDPELREICEEMIAKKELYPDADQNTNMWQIAVSTAEEHGYDRISCSPVFQKISRTILLRHFKAFFSALADTMRIALERTRLQIGPATFPMFTLIFIILFILRINIDSFTGLILMCEHIAHLCISMMNQPERRYIYSTEILCLAGWLLILIALTGRFQKSGRIRGT